MSDKDKHDTHRSDTGSTGTNRNDADRSDTSRMSGDRNDANRGDTSRMDSNRSDGGRMNMNRGDMQSDRHDGGRYDAGHYGAHDDDRSDYGRMNRGYEGGRHDGGRYDTGRFGGGFYEGGRRESGMGGRYEAERYGQGGGYGSNFGGGGYGGAYDAGYGGGYGGYGGDRFTSASSGEFRSTGRGYGGYGSYGMADYGDYGRGRMHHQDSHHEGGGARSWRMAAGAAALAAVGGYALFRQASGNKHDRQGRSRWHGIHVEESVTIDKPASEIYREWKDLENLGNILSHVEKVEMRPDGRSHWVAKGPAGAKIEWDAETVQDRANERITWRSVPGADVPNEGSVWFQERSGGRGTEVHVSLMYHPPGGKLAAGLAGLLGEEPHQQIADDLRRFKSRMESGETIGNAHKNPSARTSGNA